MSELKDVDFNEEGLCKCGAEGEELHSCPYKEEINDNHEWRCNCCDKCRHECCMDI